VTTDSLPLPPATGAEPVDPDAVLVLRPSTELRHVPEPAAGPPPPVPALPVSAAASSVPPVATALPQPAEPAPAPAAAGAGVGTWLLGGVAVLATVGWLVERRQRRLMEMEKDSVFWADRQPGSNSIITTAGSLDDILPDSPDPAEAARAIYVTAIGETASRREATLIDLHQLAGKLRRRTGRGDNVAAVLLLQQHLVDFRYSSPWVFLELLELYRVLDRQVEWETAREAFEQRFGQEAPDFDDPPTVDAGLLDEPGLCEELERDWPYREARMVILRCMLGDPEMRLKGIGPRWLGLGVYREMMLLDKVLDDVMFARTQPADSLL
jgi:hypothetical protein